MTNKLVPSAIAVEDVSSMLSVEKKFPEVENLTMFLPETDSHEGWMYYKYRAGDVIGLKYLSSTDTLLIVRLGCTFAKTCSDAITTMRGDIPFLDEKFPEWRDGNLHFLNYIKRKPVVPDDFISLQPDTFTSGETILLARKDSKTHKVTTARVYCIFAGRETGHHSLNSLLVLAKFYFSQYMAGMSTKLNANIAPNQIGKSLAYSLILGYFQTRRGYAIPDIMDIDYEVAPPMKSAFEEPLYEQVYDTQKLDEIGFGIRKSIVGSTTQTSNSTYVNSNPDEEFTLSEIIGLGIDSIIKEWQDGAKPFFVRVDMPELQSLVKTVKLQKGAVVLEVKNDTLTERELKNLEEVLDTDNIIIGYPNNTIAQNEFSQNDLRGAMNTIL